MRLPLTRGASRSTPRVRSFAALVVTVLAFMIVGSAAGPRWNPEPLTTTLDVATSSVAVGPVGTPDPVGTYEVSRRTVQVQLDGYVTDVLIVEPVGLTQPAPAVVFVHGAGTGLSTAFEEHALALASAGVVAVSPSKRLDTYSTAHRDYIAMAADYEVTWRFATTLEGVDPDRVGLYAESEGAWIAPILASRVPEVAFLALISAPIVPPRQQGAFAIDAYLRNVGVPGPLMRIVPRAAGAQLPGGILAYVDFQVRPYLEETTQPIFMAYGTDDASMPIVQGPQIVMASVPGGSDQVLLRYYEDANHGIRVGSATDPLAPGFMAGLATWMLDPSAAAAAGPQVAGATPVQVHLANTVPKPRWFADGEMMLRVPSISFTVVLAGFVLLGVSRLVAIARGRGFTGGVPGGSKRLGALAASAIVLMILLVVYVALIAFLAVNYQRHPWIVWGGWALLQVASVGAAWCVVLAGRRLLIVRRRVRLLRGKGIGSGLPARHRELTSWAVFVGCLGLLVVAAYWGAFSPLW